MTSILGTQSIQHPNGTAAASIDSGGRITKPANPAFAAYSNLSNVTMSSLANGTHHLNYFGQKQNLIQAKDIKQQVLYLMTV